ncbi:beta-ketoacyl-ACP synthase II [bacterium]
MKKRIVITGMGVVTSIGLTVEKYWDSLINGKSGIGNITFFDASAYTVKICGEVKDFDPTNYIDLKKIRKMDRFVQFAMAAGKMAIEDSSLNLDEEDRSRIGVIIGSGIGGINVIEREHKHLLDKGPRKVSPFLIPMLIINIAGGEFAIAHGLKGPNYGITSACASGTHAIGDALRLMRYGDADVMIAGGTEAAISPLGVAGFCSIKALSTNNENPQQASRPFDKNRDGFVMGEGAGIVVLETLEHAKKRGAKIYAEVGGYGASDDAYHITAPEPTAEGSIKSMKTAISDADISIDEIDYINAHGTSTYFNDKTETFAIKQVFGEKAYNIPVSSTKSMTGHLLGAAGAVEIIASVMSINTNIIHPTINYEEKDPECDLDYVPNKARKVENINAALSNSLGFGGHNATLVIKKYLG